MSFETTRQVVTARFKTRWNVANLPIVYENQPAARQDVAWGRFAIIFGDTHPLAIGGQQATRGTGIAVLQMFVPESQGTKKFTDCADLFKAIFDLYTTGSGNTYLHFGTTGIASAGKVEGFLQRHARCPFRFDVQA